MKSSFYYDGHYLEAARKIRDDVIFSPVEYLDGERLTSGALGWGRIQTANSNHIKLIDGYSRKKRMLQLCERMLDFYPKEILKIKDRMGRFDNVKAWWESREDIRI